MLRGRGGSERGSVAITVALAMTVLLGFAALVVDIGLNWAARTSAQTAADSAALAGASRLLLDGGVAAVATVETILNDNVDDLVDLPAAAGWATDGVESNGEVVCWTMPNPVPEPGGPEGNCPDGSNALQVTTPPINVQYAFAPILGQGSRSIKARAAAGAGPAAPNNCVLCVLEPDGAGTLTALGLGGIDVTGGGIVVNSDSFAALALPGDGDVSANQIRVVGGVDLDGAGDLLPPAEVGGPPVPDPLADLPTPNLLIPAPAPATVDPVQNITADTTLEPGVYDSITVNGGATLTLEDGVYVVTDFAGFRVMNGGRVLGDGATIYLACEDYPAPCDGPGARFQLDTTGQFLADPPATGAYAGLSIFADRGNTRSTRLFGDVHLTGALYAASSQLRVAVTSDVRVDALLVVDRLRAANLAPLQVNYDPSLPLPGVGVPVLLG